MMKQKLFALFTVLIFLIGISCGKKEENVQAVTSKPVEITNDLPQMPITLTDGSVLQAKTLTGSLIMILFQPDCEHCQRETEEIKKNITAFNNYTLYFVSTATSTEVETFAKQHELNEKENIRFGTISLESIFDNYGQIPAPSMYIYNGSGNLVKKFNGETDIQQVLESI